MSEEFNIDYNLNLNIEQASTQIRQLEGLLMRSLGLMSRMGMPEDMREAIRMMQRTIAIARSLHLTLILLQSAMGPIGWARGILAMGTSAIAVGQFANDVYYDSMRGT